MNSVDRTHPVPVAIIGMACMFPKAEDLARYWSNIRDRVDAITEVPESHWRPEDYWDADASAPDRTYARRGGFLTPVEFPTMEFGIAPNNLEATDTTQLLGLLVARQALEDAGYGPDRAFDRNRVSVILGVTGTLELVIPLGARLGHPIWRRALKEAGVADSVADRVVQSIADSYVPWQENSFPGLLGNVAAGRIANRLDLGGTNCVVDAACASSLAAVNLAMLELAAGRCDLVLTGGLDTFNDIFMYMCFSKTPALSPTGDARPFDASGDGTILGEGLGVLALKRLDDAKRDGDRIYAVIRSVGTSSDGKGNAVYAPSAAGQAKALRDAYRLAGFGPETVELVEAHGTGTKVGDATELSALCDVYGEAKADSSWCALGSVKSQIGHTKAAAGAAGLIKAALALHHKVLPPTAKVTRPIEPVASGTSPFYVNTEARPWMPHPDHPRRAAVSAFGFGGSNFHCVLEEAEAEKSEIQWDGDVQILAFSADSPEALDGSIAAWPRSLDWNELRAEAARSRARFRGDDPHRLLLVVDRATDLARVLDRARALPKGQAYASPAEGIYLGTGRVPGGLAMLFPGQGSQYVGMGGDLACRFPAMHAALADADRAAEDSGRLSDLIHLRPDFNQTWRTQAEQALRATEAAQPAIGAVSLGLLEILDHFGVRPNAAAGHSYGEVMALHASGRIDRRAALEISRLRGRLMAGQSGDRGAMLAVMAPLETVEQVIREASLDLVIANKNAPQQVVLSGPADEIEQAGALFVEREIATRRLAVSAAFHSRFVAEASGPFLESLRDDVFAPGALPVYSNTTARPYPDDPEEARALLAGQLAHPVEFVAMVEAMYASGLRTFVEVGPGTTLTSLVESILSGRDATALAVDGSRGRRGNVPDLARALAQLAALGYPVRLARWDEGAELRVSSARKPSLTVKVSGANASPRPAHALPSASTPAAPRPPAAPGTSAPKPSKQAPTEAAPFQINGKAHEHSMIPKNGSPAPNEPRAPRATAAPFGTNGHTPAPALGGGDPALLAQALRDAQANLVAIQKLGEQTAQLHKQFLEGQEKAQRTFQTLLEHQQRLLHPSGHHERHAVMPPPARPARAPIVHREQAVEPAPRFTPPPPRVEPAPAPVPKVPVPAVPSRASSATQQVLLEIVSEKTGYPAEMLELGMELDADLGIDSIKRVEILSAVQERLPEAPAVKPEHLGTLRTLGSIVEFLSQGAPAVPAPVVRSRPSSAIQQILLEIVSEKTGYPSEMLEPGMELDADLGIDSIKRVEILSAVQERLPDAPAVKPEHLGTLRTLGAIVEFLSDGGGTVPQSSSPSAAPNAIQSTLLEIVAEKTGYPSEMLELSMELDADLGIDSIKRVEILSAVQERLPETPAVKPEHLGTLRTLGAIVEFLAGSNAAAVPISKDSVVASRAPAPASPAGSLQRFVLREVNLDISQAGVPTLAEGAEIWITAENTGLSAALATRLEQQRLRPRIIDLNEVGSLGAPSRLDGLVLIAPVDGGDDGTIKSAFRLLRIAGPALRQSGRERSAALLTVSRLDGAFGTRKFSTKVDPAAGGLAGLAKTAAHEWPDVSCKAVDVDPALGTIEQAAQAVADELLRRGPVEVGLSARGRTTLELVSTAWSGDRIAPLERDDVVLITGGARGVTAEVAAALAEAFQPRIVVLGRSPAPAAEPDWLASLHLEADVKRALLARANGHATPRAIAEEFDRVSANREVVRNLQRIEQAGACVTYHSVDVRDSGAVASLLARVRAEHGPIRGLVHGAGVLADKRIEDQSDEQFARVYDTKVGGLRALMAALEADELRALVLFSSTTARLGRTGQVAYASANEVLNKWAQREAKARPGCRVVAVNWGPWDGGMVTSSLKPLFEAEGVALIPPRDGACYLVDELCDSGERPAEVVVLAGSAIPSPPGAKVEPQTASAKGLATVFEQPIDVASLPILRSHVLEGRPVLPMALIVEWLAQGALQRNPGLTFCGMNDLRLLKGVIARETRPETVRILAGKPAKRDSLYIVPVELRGTLADGREIPHARGDVVLGDRPPQGVPPLSVFDLPPLGLSPDEIYQSHLFHGSELQGIVRFEGCGDTGISLVASAAPHPSSWIDRPLRQSWLADPMVLDCAFQAMIVWTTERLGSGSLPTFIGRYRQFRRAFPAGGVRIVARVSQASANRAVADIEFLDTDGSCVALIEGYECVVDASLSQAFRHNQLVQAAQG